MVTYPEKGNGVQGYETMKIVFVLPSLNFSGGVKAVIQIANGLFYKGYDVSIYVPRFPKNGIINLNRLQGWVIPLCPVKMYISNIQFPNDIDLLIATSYETMYIVDELWHERKNFTPVYFIQHIETWDYYNTGEYSTKDYLALNTYLTPYPKIVVSKWLYDRVPGEKHLVPMGIEPVPDIPEEEWRNPFFNEIPYITGILRGIPWKGDDIIIKVGETQPINIYKNLSNQYLDQILWRTDIFLSASLYEGFNLPVLEAMAHGCTCIATQTGAIPEYTDNCRGICIADRTCDSFSHNLRYLYNHPEKIRELGRKGQELAKEWTIQRTIDTFEQVLYDIKGPDNRSYSNIKPEV